MNIPEPIVLLVGALFLWCLAFTAALVWIGWERERRKKNLLRELLAIEEGPVDCWAGFEEARHRYENEAV